jgi:hypothetical protein
VGLRRSPTAASHASMARALVALVERLTGW